MLENKIKGNKVLDGNRIFYFLLPSLNVLFYIAKGNRY